MTAADVKRLVELGESSTLEFKATTGQRTAACKTLCGMLNGTGSHVLFGVGPDGSIAGQEARDSTLEKVSNELSHIEPTIVPHLERVSLENGQFVIAVSVDPGQLKPYAYRGTAYKRVGNTTMVMAHHEREQLLLERMHGVARWENQAAAPWSMNDLDTDEIVRSLREAGRRGRLEDDGTTDPPAILRGLGLLGRKGEILRAAVVLFGKREHLLAEYPQCRLRLARFRGTDRTEFLDSRDLVGNAFQLLSAAQRFLIDHLPVAGRVQAGLFEREDDPLYPPAALREALANAFCHRDYMIGGGSVGVAIYDDRVEITSSGELHFGLTVADLFAPHESLPWNPLIARVFYLRGIVEQWGRGIQKMVDLTARAGLPAPEIESSGGAVTVRFLPGGYVAPMRVGHDLTERQRAILQVLAGSGALSPAAIAARIPESARGDGGRELEVRRTREALSELRSMGLVGQRGRGRGSRWFLVSRR